MPTRIAAARFRHVDYQFIMKVSSPDDSRNMDGSGLDQNVSWLRNSKFNSLRYFEPVAAEFGGYLILPFNRWLAQA